MKNPVAHFLLWFGLAPIILVAGLTILFSVDFPAQTPPVTFKDEALILRQENSKLRQENDSFRRAAFQGLVQGHVQAILCEGDRFTVVWPQTPTQP